MCKIYKILVLTMLLGCATACAKTIEEQGFATDFADFIENARGITTKDQVRQKFGSPSTVSNFGEETWYYIHTVTERMAFLQPKPVSQEVLAIVFDKEGAIINAEHYTLENGRKIKFAKDVTPAEGNELGVFEQLLGNLGRFSGSGRDRRSSGGGGRP